MNKARAVLGLCAVGLMLAMPLSTAYAGGFSIYEQGARAMGRASAFAASPDDPSAMFYNPAGLALLEGTQIYIGATVILPSGDFTGSGPYPADGVTEEQVAQTFLPPNVYISHRINEKIVVGLGISTPFGLGTKWEGSDGTVATFSGRHIAHETAIEGVGISPTVAFTVNEKLSLGVGVELRLSKLMLKRYSNFDATAFGLGILDVAKAEIETDMANAMGFNFGALFQATDQISIGVAYRSAVTVDYDGTATITQINTGIPLIDGGVALTVGDHDVTTSIDYPSVATVGVAYKLTDQLLVEADVQMWGWSVFKELSISGLPAVDPATGQLITYTETVPEDYENSMAFRLGCEYWKSEDLALRAGFVYDITPVPAKSITPLLPDASRTGFTLGIGKRFGSMTIDAAFMYLMFADADTKGEHVAYNGVYKNSGLLFGFNVGYALGR